MDLHIHIEKRHLIILSCLIAIFGIVLVSNAYGGNQPDVMGHSAGELDVEFGGNTEKLQDVFNSLDSDNNGIIDETEFAGAVEWNDINNRPDGLDDGDDTLSDTSATSNVNMNNHRITNLGSPQNSNDAATKNYVDNAGGQACDWNGWEPDVDTLGTGCAVNEECATSASTTQLYCDGGEITNIRDEHYCVKCEEAWAGNGA